MLQKHFTKILLLVLFAFTAYNTKAQVAIGASTYTTLKAAFDDINAGVQTGSIAITITGNTTETASCILNESGMGSAAYTDISITASGTGPYTITGALAATHLIDLNGADNVTIDGADILTITNTGTGISSVIRLNNDATNNMIKNVTLLGSTSTNSAGVVTFGTALVSGNDSNTLDNCKISNAGTNLPINCIFSLNATASTDNSNITVNNCQISNFFSATLGSTGININTGNSAWTITNNKLFQTATRTYTTAAVHHGVLVTTGQGYTVTGNAVGYAAAAGTGTYTMAGTLSAFYALRFTTVAGTTSSVQGNTVSNISLANATVATTAFGGILLAGTGNFDVGTVAANIIGSSSANTINFTASITGAGVVGLLSSATGIVNISNNTFGGFTLTGTTTSIGIGFTGMSISAGTNTVTFNTIGSATTANSINSVTVNIAGTQSITGINVGAVTTPTTISDNVFANFTANGTASANTCRGILYQGTGKAMIERNQINNFTSATSNTTQGTAATSIEGIVMVANSLGSIVKGNDIHTLKATNTGTTGVTVAGIGSSNPTDAVISNNKIYDLRNASNGVTAQTPSFAIGIIIRAALGTGITIVNNMISLGNGQTTNTEYVGILNSFNTTAIRAYYNTINIEGTVASGSNPSFIFLRWDNSSAALALAPTLATAVDFKNNIFTNTRSGGTGKHYLLGNNYPNATITTIGWTAGNTNYNVLNGNTSTIGFWGADKDFSTWKATTLCDNQSLSGVTTTFMNTATGDLHMNMGTTQTAIESGGTVLATYTTDYDNETRGLGSASTNGGGTAPDMGADEFDGVPLDLVGPAITSPTPPFSCSTTGNTITATIVDFSGVPTTGMLIPRIYFKKGAAGAWYSEAGVNTGGTGTNGTWDFVIDHTIVGGVVAGDFIYYYIVAQDIVGNISSNPGGVVATDVNTITTAPNPSRYQIGFTTFGGTYQVGASQAPPFNTLTDAIATFNSACTIPDPVVFELIDANYSTNETFPIVIKANPNASGTTTLTIKPAIGNNVTITGATNGSGLIKCFNSFTTIDGSNNGGTGRNMSFINTGTGTPRVIEFTSNGPIAVTDCNLKNCNITNGSQNSSAIVMLDITDNAGLFNNIVIQNNEIKKAYIGVYANGATGSAGNGSGTLFSQNTITSTGTDAIRLIALYVQGVDGGEVSYNTISNIEGANAESDRAIWLASGTTNTRVEANTISALNCTNTGAFAPIAINVTPSGTTPGNIIVRNTISNITTAGTGTPTGISMTSGSNARIEGNNVTNIKNPNTGGWGCVGINVASSNTVVLNNMVSDVAAYGFAGNTITDNGYGIAITGGSGNEVYHNNVLMNTNQTDITGLPAALLISTGVSALSVKNNILVNAQTVGTERHAIICAGTNTAFTSIDNNDYYTTGPNLGRIGATNTATLADVITGFGGNTNSMSELPVFTSATDLHLNMGTTPTLLESKGAVIATVTDDIDGQTRPGPMGSVNGGGTAPDIGADEFDGVPAALRLNAKVFLASVNTTTMKMDNYLAANSGGSVVNFPQSDVYAAAPFTSGFTHVNNPTLATTTGTVLAATTPNEVVDWIFVELRTGTSGATIVEYTKTGLLQADGDIVDTDGISPLIFTNVPFGNYYVTIRHRNHLGFRTDNLIPLSSSSPLLNFTNNSVPVYGVTPLVAVTATVYAMNGGDANFDGSIDGVDSGIWELQNGGFDNYSDNSDYNMDGSVDGVDSAIWEVNNGKYQEID